MKQNLNSTKPPVQDIAPNVLVSAPHENQDTKPETTPAPVKPDFKALFNTMHPTTKAAVLRSSIMRVILL